MDRIRWWVVLVHVGNRDLAIGSHLDVSVDRAEFGRTVADDHWSAAGQRGVGARNKSDAACIYVEAFKCDIYVACTWSSRSAALVHCHAGVV